MDWRIGEQGADEGGFRGGEAGGYQSRDFGVGGVSAHLMGLERRMDGRLSTLRLRWGVGKGSLVGGA